MNKKRIIALAFMAGLTWYWIASRPVRFTEEVALSNGQVIDVERVIKTSPVGEIGGPGGAYWKFNSIEVKSMAADAPSAPWTAPPNVMPILIDRDAESGEWMVIASFITCQAWFDAGRPLPAYLEYRWRGAWKSVPLSASSIGRPANLLVDISASGEAERIPLFEKQTRMKDPTTYKPYTGILSSHKTNCS